MHHVCHHMAGTSGEFSGNSAALLNGIGPLGLLGILLAGVLGIAFFLLWTTQREQPAHADIKAIAGGERSWQNDTALDPGPNVLFAHYDQPPKLLQVPYEQQHDQPQAQYPEMPSDGPQTDHPGMYD